MFLRVLVTTLVSQTKLTHWVLAAVLVMGAWEAWLFFRPALPTLDPARQKVADEACWRAVEMLPKLPARTTGRNTAAVLQLEGDRTSYVTMRLRAVIEQSGTYSQPEESVLAGALKKLGVAERPVTDLDSAVAAGRETGTTYVVTGRVSDFASDRQSARIRLGLGVVDVRAAAFVGQPVIVVLPQPGARLAGTWRPAVWLVVVVLLPLATIRLARRVLHLESNVLIAVMLLAYALMAWLLAAALLGFRLGEVVPFGATILAMMVASAYDYWVFALAEKARA